MLCGSGLRFRAERVAMEREGSCTHGRQLPSLTGHDDQVAVGVAHPALPVVRAAVAIGRVAVTRHNHLDGHLVGALDDGVEVVDLEPEQETVAIGFVVAIGDGAVVVLGLEAVELQDELVVEAETLVVRAAVVAAQAEEALIPAAAGFDVSDGDEGLRTHVFSKMRQVHL